MPWARGAGGAEVATSISARSLLTAMTRVMDVGTVEDQIEIAVSPISSDAIAATAIVISTLSAAEAVTEVVIGNTTDAGAGIDKTEVHRLHRLCKSLRVICG